ncbi:MAG TPA: hypothetical protein VK698_39350 [Kofleriaceae bacterium]|nr:hypothetical protein [Kofleriaceae bacterium]
MSNEPQKYADGLTDAQHRALRASRQEDTKHARREASGDVPMHCGESMGHAGDGYYRCVNCPTNFDVNSF